MKALKVFGLALIFGFVATGITFADGLKIGYVDLSKVFDGYQKTKEFDAVLRRVAEGFKQPGGHQGGDVMRLAAQHPAGLLRRQAGGQLPQQRQKLVLIVFHTRTVSLTNKKRTQKLHFSFQFAEFLLHKVLAKKFYKPTLETRQSWVFRKIEQWFKLKQLTLHCVE